MTHEIEIRTLAPQPVASVVIPGIKHDAVAAALAGALPDVFSHLSEHGAEMVGPPFARYHGGHDDTLDLEAGIPVGGAFPETDSIRARELPEGEAIVTALVGPPDKLREALGALADWRVANARVAGGPFWEVYLDDPTTADAASVRRELVAPLAPEG